MKTPLAVVAAAALFTIVTSGTAFAAVPSAAELRAGLAGRTCINSYGTKYTFGPGNQYKWHGGQSGKRRTRTYRFGKGILVLRKKNGAFHKTVKMRRAPSGQFILGSDLIKCR